MLYDDHWCFESNNVRVEHSNSSNSKIRALVKCYLRVSSTHGLTRKTHVFALHLLTTCVFSTKHMYSTTKNAKKLRSWPNHWFFPAFPASGWDQWSRSNVFIYGFEIMVLLMVQKSKGQPPGMYIAMCKIQYTTTYQMVQVFSHQPYHSKWM